MAVGSLESSKPSVFNTNILISIETWTDICTLISTESWTLPCILIKPQVEQVYTHINRNFDMLSCVFTSNRKPDISMQLHPPKHHARTCKNETRTYLSSSFGKANSHHALLCKTKLGSFQLHAHVRLMLGQLNPEPHAKKKTTMQALWNKNKQREPKLMLDQIRNEPC